MKKLLGTTILVLAMLVISSHYNLGHAKIHDTKNNVTLSGVLYFHEAGMTIGGESEPSGYVLDVGEDFSPVYVFAPEDGEQFLSYFVGSTITVEGSLAEFVYGGTETELSTYYAILDPQISLDDEEEVIIQPVAEEI